MSLCSSYNGCHGIFPVNVNCFLHVIIPAWVEVSNINALLSCVDVFRTRPMCPVTERYLSKYYQGVLSHNYIFRYFIFLFPITDSFSHLSVHVSAACPFISTVSQFLGPLSYQLSLSLTSTLHPLAK